MPVIRNGTDHQNYLRYRRATDKSHIKLKSSFEGIEDPIE